MVRVNADLNNVIELLGLKPYSIVIDYSKAIVDIHIYQVKWFSFIRKRKVKWLELFLYKNAPATAVMNVEIHKGYKCEKTGKNKNGKALLP